MRTLWLTCLIFGLPASALQADTFTAVERPPYREADSFDPNSELTVTVSPGSPEAIITFPEAIFRNIPVPWLPPVAVLANDGESRDADCYSRHVYSDQGKDCVGLLQATKLGDGRAEIRIPAEWFLEQASFGYRILKRYEHCLATGRDILNPLPGGGLGPCPPSTACCTLSKTRVSRPALAFGLSIQFGYSAEVPFVFIADSERARAWGQGGPYPPEHQPKESHYGELEKIYAWIESLGEPTDEAPRVSQILTHVFAGQLATSIAKTEITITNRTQQPCKVRVLFHRGTAEAPRVRFNGRHLEKNTLETSIEGGTAQKLALTRDAGRDLAVGAVYVEQEPGCAADALQVEGRYLITARDGQTREVFSVLPQTDSDWLHDGECRILAVDFGPNSNVGLAMVTVKPDMAAPPDTRLSFKAYDWQGSPVDLDLPALEVTGEQHALNPWSYTEPRLLRMCLDVPGTGNHFQLSMIAIAARTSSRSVQYSSQVLIRTH